MGDLIAKVGADNLGYQRIMGLHGKGVINENGHWRYPHKNIHKTTWVSPDHRTENQIGQCQV